MCISYFMHSLYCTRSALVDGISNAVEQHILLWTGFMCKNKLVLPTLKRCPHHVASETKNKHLNRSQQFIWKVQLSIMCEGLVSVPTQNFGDSLAPLSKFSFGFTVAHLLSASCQRLNYWRAKILIVWSGERATSKARGNFGGKETKQRMLKSIQSVRKKSCL